MVVELKHTGQAQSPTCNIGTKLKIRKGNESIPKIIMPFHIRAIPLEDSVGMHTMNLIGQTSGLPKYRCGRVSYKINTKSLSHSTKLKCPFKYHSSVVCTSCSLLQVLQSSCTKKGLNYKQASHLQTNSLVPQDTQSRGLWDSM
ncbi:hypothetical protein PAMP_019148 [Pampus punctatissimus]